MSTHPGTREHFPRMKERGGRRRHGKRLPRDPFVAFVAFAEAVGIAFDAWQKAWLRVMLPLGSALASLREQEATRD